MAHIASHHRKRGQGRVGQVAETKGKSSLPLQVRVRSFSRELAAGAITRSVFHTIMRLFPDHSLDSVSEINGEERDLKRLYIINPKSYAITRDSKYNFILNEKLTKKVIKMGKLVAASERNTIPQMDTKFPGY